VFDDTGSHVITSDIVSVDFGAQLVVSGDDSYVGLAGPWTADIGSSTTIGYSGLSLTPDQYAGYWIEILDGAAAGENRLILSHDATTFTLAYSGTSPGSASFRVVRFATELTNAVLTFNHFSGAARCQRLYLGAGAVIRKTQGTGTLFISHVISDSTHGIGALNGFNSPGLIASLRQSVDPDTFATNSLTNGGLSIRESGSKLDLTNTPNQGLQYMYCAAPVILKNSISGNWTFNGGRCTGGVTLAGIKDASFWTFAGGTFENASGDGITIISSEIGQLSGSNITTIKNCSGDGLVLRDSTLVLQGNAGTLTGTGITGFGVYPSLGSKITFPDGKAPTLTGTAGDMTLDGSTALNLGGGTTAVWSDVDGGTPVDADVASNKEFVVVKQV
jgi:hypothetical protein